MPADASQESVVRGLGGGLEAIQGPPGTGKECLAVVCLGSTAIFVGIFVIVLACVN